MIGKLKDLTFTRNGNQILSVELRADYTEQFDELKDGDVNVEIKKYRPKRSLDANAYCWVLLNKLSAVVKRKPEDIYRDEIREIGGVSRIVCVPEEQAQDVSRGWCRNGIGWQAEQMPSKLPGCVNLILYLGSSEYDTAQMSDLIDLIIQDCQAVGIETDTPERIEEIKSLWAAAPER